MGTAGPEAAPARRRGGWLVCILCRSTRRVTFFRIVLGARRHAAPSPRGGCALLSGRFRVASPRPPATLMRQRGGRPVRHVHHSILRGASFRMVPLRAAFGPFSFILPGSLGRRRPVARPSGARPSPFRSSQGRPGAFYTPAVSGGAERLSFDRNRGRDRACSRWLGRCWENCGLTIHFCNKVKISRKVPRNRFERPFERLTGCPEDSGGSWHRVWARPGPGATKNAPRAGHATRKPGRSYPKARRKAP